jgi:hypothetical protein
MEGKSEPAPEIIIGNPGSHVVIRIGVKVKLSLCLNNYVLRRSNYAMKA